MRPPTIRALVTAGRLPRVRLAIEVTPHRRSGELRRVLVDRVDLDALTATYARMVFDTGQGLLYPSVQARGGMNAVFPAVRFDELYEVLYTEVVHIDDYYGCGVYNVSRARFSCDLEKDGTIRWESKKEIPRKLHWIHGLEVGPFEGWTVPNESR